MRLIRFWRIGLGAAIALSVSLAFATDPVSPYPECTRKPSPADQDGAKGAHKAASQFYDRGDYEKAIRYWSDAYSFDCTAHGVLINIANAYEKQGDKAAAVTALETFLNRTGNDPTIAEKIKNLKQSMAPPVTTATAAASASVAPTAAPTAIPSAEPVAPPPWPKAYGRTPFIVVGGGAGVALIGGILLGVGTSAISSANANCPNRACRNQADVDKGNSGRIEQGVGATGLVLGLAAVGGGLAWELLFNKPQIGTAPPKMGVHVLPAAGPHDAGLSVMGSF
jgi:tetratricopeptide (TPR) repeat protein